MKAVSEVPRVKVKDNEERSPAGSAIGWVSCGFFYSIHRVDFTLILRA